jgi:hypothetical protein
MPSAAVCGEQTKNEIPWAGTDLMSSHRFAATVGFFVPPNGRLRPYLGLRFHTLVGDADNLASQAESK